MMRLFISGPMRSLPDKNRPAFLEAETTLRIAGYRVVNPTRCHALGATWESAMRHHIASLMDCDGLAYLTGWEDSQGARIEVGLMRDLGLPTRSVPDWLSRNPAKSVVDGW